MVVSIKRRVVRRGIRCGVICPKEWNGYPVTILIKPKGLWKGIKYRNIKARGKRYRVMSIEESGKYSSRLIWEYSHVGSMFCAPSIQFAKVPEKYEGMMVEVSITLRPTCEKCGHVYGQKPVLSQPL